METDGINALNPAPDVGGVLPPQINRPGPVIDYLTRPMVPSPASRRRDTLKGIAQFLPFISGELAKAEGDKLGVALSGLDFLGAAGAPAKAVVKKGIDAIPDQATKNFSDAMKSKNLMFVHNTSEEAIRSFDAMGGLPSPSLAVTESEIPLRGFGKIQLIGKPEKFDPAIDPRNKVYSADAYTPRAPKKLRLAKEGAESKLTKEYKALADKYNKTDTLEEGQYALRNLQKDNMYFPENRLSDLDRFFNSDLAKLKFLEDKGFKVDDFLEGPRSMAMVDFDSKIAALSPNSPFYKQAIADPNFRMTKKFNEWSTKEKDRFLSQDGVLQYFDDFEETTVTKPYTLENAVNSMIKETQRGGEGFSGGYSPARMKALMSREFKDLPDIKSERDRLVQQATPTYGLDEQIGEVIEKYDFPFDDNDALYFGEKLLADVGDAIENGAKFDKSLLRDSYSSVFSDVTALNPFEPPKGFIDDLEDVFLGNAIRNVEYFEAKPIRAVGFDEFAGAIVPKNTSQDVIDILEKRGLKVIKQTDADFTEDFMKTGARKKHFQDQMFSFAPIAGAGGITALSIDKNTEDEDKGLGSL
mgnify:CR=1 FL=1